MTSENTSCKFVKRRFFCCRSIAYKKETSKTIIIYICISRWKLKERRGGGGKFYWRVIAKIVSITGYSGVGGRDYWEPEIYSSVTWRCNSVSYIQYSAKFCTMKAGQTLKNPLLYICQLWQYINIFFLFCAGSVMERVWLLLGLLALTSAMVSAMIFLYYH